MYFFNCQENIIFLQKTKHNPLTASLQDLAINFETTNIEFILKNLLFCHIKTNGQIRKIQDSQILNWLLDSVKSFETKQGMGQILIRCEIFSINFRLDFF